MKTSIRKTLFLLLLLVADSTEAAPKWITIDPQTPNLAVLAKGWTGGHVSSGLSNQSSLVAQDYQAYEITFQLHDSTQVGGLYFPYHDKDSVGTESPLLICTFGFLADRWSPPAAQFIRDYLQAGLIHANVLILDHPSSGPFYFFNQTVSPGAYDEARMILEIAHFLASPKTSLKEPLKVHDPSPLFQNHKFSFSSIHLMGVSMGGAGVIHALAEDQRLGLNLFGSAITFSAVTDLSLVPFVPLDRYSSGRGGTNLSAMLNNVGISMLEKHFNQVVSSLSKRSFSIYQVNSSLQIFYRMHAAKRLRLLGEKLSADDLWPWNPELNFTSSLEDRSQASDEVLMASYLEKVDINRIIGKITTPLLMVHALDDPAVPIEHLYRVEQASISNPMIATLSVPYGGHWGFSFVYGTKWVSDLIQKVIDPSAQ